MPQNRVRAFSSPVYPRIALVLVLAGILVYARQTPSAELFGRVHFDDAVFFASAKALADGEGFVVANMPGAPAQTKYPILYPWALSLVWRADPSFPGNIAQAVWMNAALGCVFLALSFFYLRRQPGIGEWAAVGCVALTASQAQFLDLSSSLMSEPLFMTLAMATLLFADLGLERKRQATMALAGFCAGLSFLTRTAGVAFILGVLGCSLWRRDFRKSAAFAAGCAPFVLAQFAWVATAATPPPAGAAAGWLRVWTYSTSYPAFWKLSVPNGEVLLSMLNANFTTLLKAPANLTLFSLPSGGAASFVIHLIGIALSMGIVSGLIRQNRGTGITAAHIALGLTAALSVAWNFPIVERMLLVFTPLFCLGAWVEARHVGSSIVTALRTSQSAADKAVVGAFGLLVVAVGVVTLRAHALAPFRLHQVMTTLAASMEEQDQASRWLSENTGADSVVLAYSDARVYLETGRLTSWPVVFTTDILFAGGEQSLQRQFDEYLDVGRQIGATYWIVTDNEMAANTEIGGRRLAELEAQFPVSFRSSKRGVRIHDLRRSCVGAEPAPGCEPAGDPKARAATATER